MELDINYLAESLATLCGLPVRIYKNKKLINIFSHTTFDVDPIKIDEENILNNNNHIGYYANEFFYYYGYINFNDMTLVIGPSREIDIDSFSLTSYAIKLGLEGKQINNFKSSMSLLIPMPLSSLMQSLATFNYVLNGEKTNVSDLIVDNSYKSINTVNPKRNEANIHNTYEIEKQVLEFVKNGDVVSFDEFIKKAQSIRGGVLSNDYIRNLKNTFIVVATLISREAINAGLDINDSLRLSDLYIRQVELLNNPDKIINLEYQMVKDYIENVNKIKSPNDLVLKINRYILKNISSFITTSDLADYLIISRSSLCKNFKKLTNKTVNEYILEYKINYSKELIKNGVPLSVIAFNLGFSSQQHFSNVFKKITNKTPKEYLQNKGEKL